MKAIYIIVGLVHTCEDIFVSKPLRPDSREPTRCINVFVSKFNIKVMWLLNKTSKNAKYALVNCKVVIVLVYTLKQFI